MYNGSDPQGMYQRLQSVNLGVTPDDYFRSLGFPSGRQDAIDFMSHMRDNDPAIQAKNAYKAATDTAVKGLTDQRSNLAGQYSDLLKTVSQQYQPLINQTTATAGAAESARGLTPDSQLFQQQVQGALQPVYGQEAGNAQQIGLGSVSDYNTLTQAIAQMQLGAAGTAAGLPLQYGSLALSQAANIANIGLAGAQTQQASAGARYVAIPGLGVYDLNAGQLMPNSSSTGLTTNGPTITGVQFGK